MKYTIVIATLLGSITAV
jgi:hypothetical protein